jgi:hypothetical protein
MLGVVLSPSGDERDLITALHTIAEDYASQIASSSINREAAYWSFLLCFTPKVSYPLSISSLTEQQCNQIQSQAVFAVLPNVHIKQNTARSIIFRLLKLGGLSLPNMFMSQCISSIKFFIGHLHWGEKTSSLIRISMSYLQIILCSDQSFLSLQYPKYNKWIEHGWLKSIWKALHRTKLKITVKN